MAMLVVLAVRGDHGHQHIEISPPWVSEPNSIHRTDQRHLQALATGLVEHYFLSISCRISMALR